MNYIGLAAIAGCYLAIIGMYVWVFRQIQEVKTAMSEHMQQSGVHVDSDKLVFKDVCDQKVLRIEEKIDGMKESVDEMKESIKGGFSEVKEMIRSG